MTSVVTSDQRHHPSRRRGPAAVPPVGGRLAGARRGVGRRRLPRARAAARPVGHRSAALRDRRVLRDRGPVAERAARLRRPDLARPRRLRRHRRVHVGLPGDGAGPVVLGRRHRRRRARRRSGADPRRRVVADHRPLLRPDHAVVRLGCRAEHLPDPGVHRRRGRPTGTEAGLVRHRVALLLPVPRVPRPRALRRLADDAHQGRAGAAGPAREPPGRVDVRHQRAPGDAARVRRLRRLRRSRRRAHRPRRRVGVGRRLELPSLAVLRDDDGGRRPAVARRARDRRRVLRPAAATSSRRSPASRTCWPRCRGRSRSRRPTRR